MNVIPAKNYLELNPRHGRTLDLSHLGNGLEAYVLKSTFLMAPDSIAIKDNYIIEESALYDANIGLSCALIGHDDGSAETLGKLWP